MALNDVAFAADSALSLAVGSGADKSICDVPMSVVLNPRVHILGGNKRLDLTRGQLATAKHMLVVFFQDFTGTGVEQAVPSSSIHYHVPRRHETIETENVAFFLVIARDHFARAKVIAEADTTSHVFFFECFFQFLRGRREHGDVGAICVHRSSGLLHPVVVGSTNDEHSALQGRFLHSFVDTDCPVFSLEDTGVMTGFLHPIADLASERLSFLSFPPLLSLFLVERVTSFFEVIRQLVMVQHARCFGGLTSFW